MEIVVAKTSGGACVHTIRLRKIKNETDAHSNNRTLADLKRTMKTASTNAPLIGGGVHSLVPPAFIFRDGTLPDRSAAFLDPLNLGTIMSSKQTLVVVALLSAALLGQRAMAEEPASASQSRETVKEDARAAQRAGRLTPAGEGSLRNNDANVRSTKTRAERKAETLKASKQGNLTPAGEGGNRAADHRAPSQTSTLSRAERKAETLRAAKRGELMPAGEGQGTGKK